MQAQTPEVSTEKATTPRYDTIVIRGATGHTIPKEVDGGEVIAWSVGHGLAAMDALEEYVDNLAAGHGYQPTHLTQSAADAMNLMRRRRVLGWDSDEPTEQPPADWKTAVARAVATVRKVFDGCDDEAKDAIAYMEGMLLANEPATPSTPEVETILSCDYCGAEAADPWHGSGLKNGVEARHIHACDDCRHMLPSLIGASVVEGRAADIVSKAIDGPCRESETVLDMAEVICTELANAGLLRMSTLDAIDFKVPMSKVLERFGLLGVDAESLASELAVSLIPHLAQFAEDQRSAINASAQGGAA